MTFDLATFKQGWRALATQYHFDPLTGPTSYELVLIHAAQAARPEPLHWSTYCPVPLGGGLEARDDTEKEAWTNIEQLARRAHHMRTSKESFRSLYQETVVEWKTHRHADLDDALRQNMQPLRRPVSA